jgi:hypothetical protein
MPRVPSLQVTTLERFLHYHIQCSERFRMEKLPACSVAAGRPILTQTIILDMSGLSPLKHFTLTVQKFLHTLSQVDSVSGSCIYRDGSCRQASLTLCTRHMRTDLHSTLTVQDFEGVASCILFTRHMRTETPAYVGTNSLCQSMQLAERPWRTRHGG